MRYSLLPMALGVVVTAPSAMIWADRIGWWSTPLVVVLSGGVTALALRLTNKV